MIRETSTIVRQTYEVEYTLVDLCNTGCNNTIVCVLLLLLFTIFISTPFLTV